MFQIEEGRWLDVPLARDLVLALLEVWAKNIKGPFPTIIACL